MGIPPEEARRRSLDVLEHLGMRHHAASPPHTLSGGEKKLAALGTLLSMNPRLMLLDEPTTALDEDAEEMLVQILREFPGMLCIASHDEAFLKDVTVRELWLRNGKIESS
jgi:cobalt/nickel transport system ATP-binding protein